MKKLLLTTAIIAAASVSTSANATLASDATLSIDPAVLGGYYGNVVLGGSYFAMDNDGSGAWEKKERVGLAAGSDGGINLGQAQTGTSEDFSGGTGSIDTTWNFFGNPGNHTQNATLAVVAGTNTIDMTGWTVFWGDPANGGIDPSGNPTRGPIDMGAGAAAIVTCDTAACAASESYTLTYNAVVPSGGFAGVAYQLVLTGTVGAGAVIPVPAAAWLFGSGLLGLVGVARRKKSA